MARSQILFSERRSVKLKTIKCETTEHFSSSSSHRYVCMYVTSKEYTCDGGKRKRREGLSQREESLTSHKNCVAKLNFSSFLAWMKQIDIWT